MPNVEAAAGQRDPAEARNALGIDDGGAREVGEGAGEAGEVAG